jgi:protein-S-isoprenylcysteine O-methyltransferase Ste14
LKGAYRLLTTQWLWLRWGILGLCWGLFCLVWLIGAIYNLWKAPAVQKRSGPWGAWIIGIVLFAGIVWLIPHRFWSLLTFDTPWLRVIGIICLLLSTAFTLWARWVLGTMWSFSAVAKASHELRTDGPYRITRHPIYTGLLGMFFGTVLMSGLGHYLSIFILAIVIFEVKLHLEERLMTETFGEQYVEYKRRVPQLIPGLKSSTQAP